MLKNGENCKILPVDIVDNFLIKNEGKSAVLPAALFPIVFEYNLLIFNPHLIRKVFSHTALLRPESRYSA